MLIAVNLMLCLFILCIFGVLDGPLRDLSLRPAVGSLLCLLTAGLMLLEDVELTDALLANPGGFFMPIVCAMALCAGARHGTQKYLLLMSVFIGVGTWMFNQIAYRALEATQEYAIVFQGLFCLVFANVLDHEIKPVLMMSIFGFYLCDVMSYIITIASGQSAFMVLGDGIRGIVMVGMLVSAVALCRLRAFIKRQWLKHSKEQPIHEVQPETL